jgi:ABC-type multidrug transport system ATPase subunit
MTLVLEGVSLPRGKVRDLHAEFAAGVHLIVGPNGVGKTSLLNAIAGTLPLSSGRIYLDGAPLTSGSRDVVLAPNAPPEIPWIRAGLLLDFIVSLYPATRRDAQTAASIVDRLGISDLLGAPLGTLSAGSARKLMLASALIAAPPVMLFDEPTNETDVASIGAFVDMVGELATRNVVIITTHHAKDLESLAPGVLTLK